MTQQPSPDATAGDVFSTQPIVEEVDPYGNLVVDSIDTVTAARGDVGTSTLLGGNLTVTMVDGVARFVGLSYNKAESMDITFTTKAAGISAATSDAILIGPTTASQLIIHQQPATTATAGQSFGTQPVVYEEDQFGNLETGDSSTQVTAMLASGTGPLQGTITVTLSGGVARFSNLADDRAETITLDFGAGLLLSAASNAIVVGPWRRQQAGHRTGLLDHRHGRPAARRPHLRRHRGTPTATSRPATTPRRSPSRWPPAPAELLGTTTVTVQDGVATFPGLSDTVAGTISGFRSPPATA